MNFSLVMPAAGSGSRLGVNIPKALVEVGGLPLFIHSVLPFFDFPNCVEGVIAAPAEYVSRFRSLATWYLPGRSITVISGGQTRQESVGKAISALAQPAEAILVHDAARPFLTQALIQRVLDAMEGDYAAAAPAIAIVDTIKRATGAPLRVVATVDRSGLYAVQTPQALRRPIAEEAFRRLANEPFAGTDDVSLVEHFGMGSVRLVEGDPGNVKITTAGDLQRARDRLAHSQ